MEPCDRIKKNRRNIYFHCADFSGCKQTHLLFQISKHVLFYIDVRLANYISQKSLIFSYIVRTCKLYHVCKNVSVRMK